MSFSKAKIQRFNDLKDCTPSPAKYNITTQEKIKLGFIYKSGKFAFKAGSPKHSDSGSVQSTPCFQTPTLPTKRKKLLSSFKKSSHGKLTEQEELRNKTVECNNKDVYIKDLTEQIEEMLLNIRDLEKANERLKEERNEFEGALDALKEQNKQDHLQRAKEYTKMSNSFGDVNKQLRQIRQECEELRAQNLVNLSKISACAVSLKDMYDKSMLESRLEREKIEQKYLKEIETLNEEMKIKEEQYSSVKCELKSVQERLNESEAKAELLEENFKDTLLLRELQMKQKLEEIEASWKQKFEDKEKESEAILKECQEISEYSIIECEIEKNRIKKQLEEKEESYNELQTKYDQLEEAIKSLKIEKHAYELSITTFKDTNEVLKKRLFNSDRDVEQLKEELEKCEEKILHYEKKCTDLTTQLNETQTAHEELEMQYESTSKLVEAEVKTIERDLLMKVNVLREECKQLAKNKALLQDVLEQHHEQQFLINEAHAALAKSSSFIEALESKEIQLESELAICKFKLEEESEEAAEIRKKYIEKSGKYDELAQQFEQILQELDRAKNKIQILKEERVALKTAVDDLEKKYAELLGHHNHHQKIKHVEDLKIKNSELFQQNMDLESKNYKLNKKIEKLAREVDDLRKSGKKLKIGGDGKENLMSPKCTQGTHSPGPLKDKN